MLASALAHVGASWSTQVPVLLFLSTFLLEVMAHVGAMPSLHWLREGLGIDARTEAPLVGVRV